MLDIWLVLCGLDGDLFQWEQQIDLDSKILRYKLAGLKLSEQASLCGTFSSAEQFILNEIASVGFAFKLLQERVEVWECSSNPIEHCLGTQLDNELVKKYLNFLTECEKDSLLQDITKILQRLEPWKTEFTFWLNFQWKEYVVEDYSDEKLQFLNNSIIQWIQDCMLKGEEISYLPERLQTVYKKGIEFKDKISMPNSSVCVQLDLNNARNLEQILNHIIQKYDILLWTLMEENFGFFQFSSFLHDFTFLNNSSLWNDFFRSVENVLNVRKRNFIHLEETFTFISINEQWGEFDFCTRGRLFSFHFLEISSKNQWFLLYFDKRLQDAFNLLLSIRNALYMQRDGTNLVTSLHVQLLLFLLEYFEQDVIRSCMHKFQESSRKVTLYSEYSVILQELISSLNEGLFLDAPFIVEKITGIIHWKYNNIESLVVNLTLWKELVKVLVCGMHKTIEDIGHLPYVGMFLQRISFNSFFLNE